MRLLPSAIAVLSTLCAAPVPAAATRGAGPPADPSLACRQAIAAAEREHRLPAALLHAIGRVESGRPDPRTGGVVSWPWTINAEGLGRFFDSKEAAVAAVRALRARGVTVIDVGCMQVNLHHHPRAFASLEEAFDPLANARYAGLFLARLRQDARDWETAAARYHSRTPERAEAYKSKVLAAWPGMARRAAEEQRRVAEEQRRDAMVAAWVGGGRAAAGLGAQAYLLRQGRAVLGVVGRHHGIVRRQPPPLPVLVGREIVGRLEMPLQHLQLLAVLQADQVLGRHRLLDRDGRLRAFGFRLRGGLPHAR